jgi:hypothetical protein
MKDKKEDLQFHRATHTSELILKYLRNKLSRSEQKDLVSWITENELHRETFSALNNSTSLSSGLHEFDKYNVEAARKKLIEKLFPPPGQE